MALTDNLLAFYKLSDLTDSSGNNRTLTNNGGVTFTSGKIGNAAVFDGSNKLVTSMSISSFSNITISGWCKSSDYTNSPVIVGYANSDVGQEFMIGTASDGNFYGCFNNGSSSGYPGGVQAIVDEWNFFVLTYDGTTFSSYFNGQKNTAELGPLPSGEGTIVFGQAFTGSAYEGRVFNGQIDAVGIWDRALSEQEVAALYNSGTGLELDGGNGGGGGGNPTLVKMEAPIKFFGKVKFGV